MVYFRYTHITDGDGGPVDPKSSCQGEDCWLDGSDLAIMAAFRLGERLRLQIRRFAMVKTWICGRFKSIIGELKFGRLKRLLASFKLSRKCFDLLWIFRSKDIMIAWRKPSPFALRITEVGVWSPWYWIKVTLRLSSCFWSDAEATWAQRLCQRGNQRHFWVSSARLGESGTSCHSLPYLKKCVY